MMENMEGEPHELTAQYLHNLGTIETIRLLQILGADQKDAERLVALGETSRQTQLSESERKERADIVNRLREKGIPLPEFE
ncbi:MAG: hypothetical protein HYT31_00310 [Parcubacteria group bacterium]|nr:hypothetical protein [Parcubacteria group bacterium]